MAVAAPTPAEVRYRMAARITGVDGSLASPLPYEAFRLDSDEIGHKHIAAGVIRTTSVGGRQRGDSLVLAETEVRIRYGYRIKPVERQLTAVDDAMTWGLLLTRTLLTGDDSTPWPGAMSIVWTDHTHTTGGQFYFGEIGFTVRHSYSLTT